MLSGINKPSAGEQLYLLAFFIFLISETFSTTMFQLPGSAYTLCKAVSCLLLIIKVFRFDEFSRKTFFIFVLLILETILVYVNSGYMEVFFWVLFVMSAKNVSLKKILKVYLIVTISIVLLAFCASMLQVIENLQYTRGDGKRVRNSFGAIYTTDFASHIFMIMMSAFYLLKDKLKTWHFILGAVVGVLVYWFCNTRLDMGCLFLMLICFYCINIRCRSTQRASGNCRRARGDCDRLEYQQSHQYSNCHMCFPHHMSILIFLFRSRIIYLTRSAKPLPAPDAVLPSGSSGPAILL